jgi:hypothetical protein
VLYTAGVIGFSLWSYSQQRAGILAQADLLIIHSTHAVDQILRDTFTGCLISAEAPDPARWADLQKNLNRFADDCRFDLVGAVGFRDGKPCHAVYGGRRESTISAAERLTSNPHEFFNLRTDSLDGSVHMDTVESDAYGPIRMAVSYRAVTDRVGYAIQICNSARSVHESLSALAIRTAAIAVFLCAMAVPLIMFYNLAQARSARRTAELNARLQEDYIKLKEREGELQDAIRDLERFNAVAIGREGRIIELKAEVNALLGQMQQDKRYQVDHME